MDIYVDGGTDHGEMYGSFRFEGQDAEMIMLGPGTNQRAEVLILLHAMKLADCAHLKSCVFHTDSEWTYYKLHARNGRYASAPMDAYYWRGNSHADLFQEIRKLMALNPTWTIVWNPRSVSVAQLGH